MDQVRFTDDRLKVIRFVARITKTTRRLFGSKEWLAKEAGVAVGTAKATVKQCVELEMLTPEFVSRGRIRASYLVAPALYEAAVTGQITGQVNRSRTGQEPDTTGQDPSHINTIREPLSTDEHLRSLNDGVSANNNRSRPVEESSGFGFAPGATPTPTDGGSTERGPAGPRQASPTKSRYDWAGKVFKCVRCREPGATVGASGFFGKLDGEGNFRHKHCEYVSGSDVPRCKACTGPVENRPGSPFDGMQYDDGIYHTVCEPHPREGQGSTCILCNRRAWFMDLALIGRTKFYLHSERCLSQWETMSREEHIVIIQRYDPEFVPPAVAA